ncbi:MAG: efflux RND transporter periplasmic adaptor subunit [Fibrobacteria bacterium]
MSVKPGNSSTAMYALVRKSALPMMLIALVACGRDKEKTASPPKVPDGSAVFQSPTSTVLTGQRSVRLIRMKFTDTLEVPVRIDLDERRSVLVTAPAAGRLEKIFIRSPDQSIVAGEAIASFYSPELVTAQREFLLLSAKNDPGLFGNAASRLEQMGMNSHQIQGIRRTGKPLDRIPIASPKSGFVVLMGAPASGESMVGSQGAPNGSAAMGSKSGGGGGMGMSGEAAASNPSAGSGISGLNTGAYLERGAPLATVNDLRVVAASLALPIDQAGFFREGDSIHLSLPSLGLSAMARLDFLESRISDTNRTLTGKAYLSNPGFKLKVGSLGKAHLTALFDSAWVLPRSAVHSLGEKWIVWSSSGKDMSAFKAREVRLGRKGLLWVEITEGLNPGEAVAEIASLLLDRDAVVEPVELPDSSYSLEPGLSHENSPDHPDSHKTTSKPMAHDDHAAKPSEENHENHGQAIPATGHASGKEHADPKSTLTLSSEEEILAGIASAKARVRLISPSTTFRATTRFDDRSSERIPARVDGTVDQVRIRRPGEKVSKGQVLAEIRSDALMSAQQEFLLSVSQSKTLPDQAMAGSQVQAARRRLIVLGMSETQVDALVKAGRSNPRVPIISPRAGVILSVDVQPGQYVREGASLFTIGGGDRIWIETWMLPEETKSYPEGTDAWVEIEGRHGEPLLGKLEHMKQETSISGALAIAHIGIPNLEGRILSGAQAWVTLKEKGRQALTIPPSALLESSGSSMAWLRIGPQSFAPRMLKIGMRTSEAVEVLEGIEPGEDVVVSGAYLLNSEYVIRQGAGMGHGGH